MVTPIVSGEDLSPFSGLQGQLRGNFVVDLTTFYLPPNSCPISETDRSILDSLVVRISLFPGSPGGLRFPLLSGFTSNNFPFQFLPLLLPPLCLLPPSCPFLSPHPHPPLPPPCPLLLLLLTPSSSYSFFFLLLPLLLLHLLLLLIPLLLFPSGETANLVLSAYPLTTSTLFLHPALPRLSPAP